MTAKASLSSLLSHRQLRNILQHPAAYRSPNLADWYFLMEDITPSSSSLVYICKIDISAKPKSVKEAISEAMHPQRSALTQSTINVLVT